jgi:ketosteroid isomerase-like protein
LSTSDTGDREELLRVEKAWSQAIAVNDLRGIGEHAAEAWVMVTIQGTITTRATFIAVVTSGDLVHDRLDIEPDIVRVYGDSAIISGVVRSSGTWKGQRFATHERSTDLFVRQGERWRCAFTQLTAFASA